MVGHHDPWSTANDVPTLSFRKIQHFQVSIALRDVSGGEIVVFFGETFATVTEGGVFFGGAVH